MEDERIKRVFKANTESSQGGTTIEIKREHQDEVGFSNDEADQYGLDFYQKKERLAETVDFSTDNQIIYDQDKYNNSDFSSAFMPKLPQETNKKTYRKSKHNRIMPEETYLYEQSAIESKTKVFSKLSKVLGVICCVLIVVVGAPFGYNGIKTYFAKNKPDVVLPTNLAQVCAARLTSEPPDLAIPLDTRIDEQRLSEHMENLINNIGNRFVDTDGNSVAKNYIISKLAEQNYITDNNTLWTEPFEIDIEASRQVKRKKKPKPSTGDPSKPEKPSNGQNHDSVEGSEDIPSSTKPNPDKDKDDEKDDEYEIVTETYHVYYNTENVIAVKPTAVSNPQIIVVSAHIDTVYNTRGAIDNGSGVAAVLEIARVIGETRRDYGVEVRFCFFSGEELGMHGAFKYLENLSEDERSRHIAMINIDMAASSISDIPKAFSISTYGKNLPSGYVSGTFETPANNSVSAAALSAFAKNNFEIPKIYAPIHWEKNDIRPFHRAKIDAATISWREIDNSRAITNYDIASPFVMHTPEDVLSTMDMGSLNQTTRFAVEMFEELCRAARGETASIIGEL